MIEYEGTLHAILTVGFAWRAEGLARVLAEERRVRREVSVRAKPQRL